MPRMIYALRWEVLLRDNFTCQYCGRSAPDVILHVDHKNPQVNGGTNDKDNLITACSACNIGKNLKPLFPSELNHYRIGNIKPMIPLKETIELYLTNNGPATATEIAKALSRNRVNICKALRAPYPQPVFSMVKKCHAGAYYDIYRSDGVAP